MIGDTSPLFSLATAIDKSTTIIDANLTLESVVFDEEAKGKIKEAVEQGEAGLDGVGGALRSVLQAWQE